MLFRLITASDKGHTAAVRMLLLSGANVNAKDNAGNTALIITPNTTVGHADVVRLLLAKGAKVDAANNNGNTSLMSACIMGNSTIVRLLLAAGANVNAADNKGNTPLMFASITGSTTVVKLLLAAHANINAFSGGATALTLASAEGNTGVVQLLQAALTQRSPTAASTTQRYRALTPEDGLNCAARAARMEITFSGPPSGELVAFECLDKEDHSRSIKLKSTEVVDGKVKTQDFGIIHMMQTNGISATYEMTEDQIKKLKIFLGF